MISADGARYSWAKARMMLRSCKVLLYIAYTLQGSEEDCWQLTLSVHFIWPPNTRPSEAWMRRFFPMNCESQKVASSLFILLSFLAHGNQLRRLFLLDRAMIWRDEGTLWLSTYLAQKLHIAVAWGCLASLICLRPKLSTLSDLRASPFDATKYQPHLT
jgi:hypothetical protein